MSITQDFIQYLLDKNTEDISGFDFEDREDKIDAEKVYDAIAKSNNPVAYRILGDEYLKGSHGIGRNRQRGLQLLKIGAKLGDIKCQDVFIYFVQMSIEGGCGIKKDISKATYYYQLIPDKYVYCIDTEDKNKMLRYSLEEIEKLKKQVKEQAEKIKAQEEKIVELKYRPFGKGYEEALADFTRLSE